MSDSGFLKKLIGIVPISILILFAILYSMVQLYNGAAEHGSELERYAVFCIIIFVVVVLVIYTAVEFYIFVKRKIKNK
jgi:hypothetical protein